MEDEKANTASNKKPTQLQMKKPTQLQAKTPPGSALNKPTGPKTIKLSKPTRWNKPPRPTASDKTAQINKDKPAQVHAEQSTGPKPGKPAQANAKQPAQVNEKEPTRPKVEEPAQLQIKKPTRPKTFNLRHKRKRHHGLSLVPWLIKVNHGHPMARPNLKLKTDHTLNAYSGVFTDLQTPTCACSPSGFKKLLNHVVFKRRHSEAAHYNRHKHHISHDLVNASHRQRLSKTFAYLSLNKIKFCIATSLKRAYGQPYDQSMLCQQPRMIKPWHEPKLIKSCVHFMGDVMESLVEPNLSRNQFSLGLRHARQKLNHNPTPKQPLGLTCVFLNHEQAKSALNSSSTSKFKAAKTKAAKTQLAKPALTSRGKAYVSLAIGGQLKPGQTLGLHF